MKSKQVILLETIENKIFILRGQRVMIDRDLAGLYEVPTKVLNQAVKRNIEKFPDDFMFTLTKVEKEELVTDCDRFKSLKHSTSLPYAFTEHGTLMLASVLNSSKAVEVSIFVVRAFIRLRQILAANKELAEKLIELELKLETHDQQITAIFDAINQLLAPPPMTKRKIGFEIKEKKVSYRKARRN
jgi:hypothetical protein